MRRAGCPNFKGANKRKKAMHIMRSLRKVLPAVALFALCGVSMADVTLPADVTAAISDFEAQGTALISAVMPTVKALLFAMFGIVALWFCYRQVRKVLGK